MSHQSRLIKFIIAVNIEDLNRQKIGYIVLAAFILIIWGILKWTKFNLGFYFSDLYVHDQLSRLWFFNEPFWFDYRFGNSAALHNYWLIPLFSVFTIPLGVPGLFVAHLLITIVTILSIINHKSPDKYRLLLLFGIFLGPFAYWLFDNRPYGWHPELLYFPLSVLIALSIEYKNKAGIILSALLTLLLREDGVIVWWAIAGYYLVVSKKQTMWSRSFILLSLGCFLIFLAGLVILNIIGDGQSRVNESFQIIFHQPIPALLNLLRNYLQLCLFSLPIASLYLIFGHYRKLIIILILSFPLVLAAWVSGMHYFPDNYHGMLWQPRIAAIWGVMLAGLLFENNTLTYVRSTYQTFLGVMLLWIMQFVLLIVVRDHNLYTMSTDILREEKIYRNDPFYPIYKNLAKEIDTKSTVCVPFEYFHVYHRHILYWFQNDLKEEKSPDYLIARASDTWHLKYSSGYDSTVTNGLTVKWKSRKKCPPSLTKQQ